MTFESLKPGQRRILEIIRELNFGRIERLAVVNGDLCFGQATRIIQDVKLGSEQANTPAPGNAEFIVNKAFEDLFTRLKRLPEGLVDIEVRHGAPFRLFLEVPAAPARTGE